MLVNMDLLAAVVIIENYERLCSFGNGHFISKGNKLLVLCENYECGICVKLAFDASMI